MNDRELELRLREELQKRIVSGDAPDRLFDHIARLGFDEPALALRSPARARRFRQRAGLFGGLAAAAGIAAIIVAGLFWRADHGPIAATSSAGPSSFSPSPTYTLPSTSVPPIVVWNGSPVDVRSFGRLDASFGWATGSTGQDEALYLTDDGGLTWDKRQLPYYSDAGPVSGIVFTDRGHAFVAATTGASGAFSNAALRSNDGGHTWTRAVVVDHSKYYVSGLDMLDSGRGWLVLCDERPVWRLYGTTDGGATWSLLVDGAAASVSPMRVRFVSADEGWAYAAKGGLDTILHTLDGGKTWAAATLPAPAGYVVLKREGSPRSPSGKLVLHGSAAQNGTSSRVRVTWTSTDAGQHWTVDGVEPLGDARELSDGAGDLAGYEETPTDSTRSLVLVGSDGEMSSFAAAGLAAFVPAGKSGWVTSARALSGKDAWVTIDICIPSAPMSGIFRSCPRLVATSDGGKTWRPLLWQSASGGATPTPVGPVAPPCCTMNTVGERQRPREPLTDWLDTAHGWAVVGTSLYWTTDGGQTWDSGSTLPASGTIQFVDAQRGWLVPSDSSDPGSTVYSRTPVYRTSDGGRTWTSTDLPTTTSEPNWTWARFVDSTHGVIARCPQLIAGQNEADCDAFTTDDGGLTFQGPVKKTYPTPITWLSQAVGYGIAFDFAGGFEQSGPPLLNLTFDGGRTWTSQALEKLPGTMPGAFPLAMELTPGGKGRLLVSYGTSEGKDFWARYETVDGGQSWHIAWHASSPAPVYIVRVAGGSLVGMSPSSFWASSDFGVTWKQLAQTPVEVHDFAFVDASTGFVARAPTYTSPPDALLATTDGGRTWHVVLRAPTIITNP